ncbi:MAG: hypothetical protein E6G94_04080 [Alphaproteobacteria bacterium]|nr:MAG: hypothetical protein E6G94_04080 [Alphaproteobacteria bacterium]
MLAALAVAAPAPAAPGRVREAEAFMAAYAQDLRSGDRAAIAGRYDRRGAWRVGNGEKSFSGWQDIRARYQGPAWSPPSSFAWRELSFEPVGEGVVVAGLFDWGVGAGKPVLTFSYSALLVRRGGALRIRLEDESGPAKPRAPER